MTTRWSKRRLKRNSSYSSFLKRFLKLNLLKSFWFQYKMLHKITAPRSFTVSTFFDETFFVIIFRSNLVDCPISIEGHQPLQHVQLKTIRLVRLVSVLFFFFSFSFLFLFLSFSLELPLPKSGFSSIGLQLVRLRQSIQNITTHYLHKVDSLFSIYLSFFLLTQGGFSLLYLFYLSSSFPLVLPFLLPLY